MRYLLRTSSKYCIDGFLEWSPGKNRWYLISQSRILPEEIQKQLVAEVSPEVFRGKKVLVVEGFFSQNEGTLTIIRIVSRKEPLEATLQIANEDWVENEDLMFFEDLWSLDEYL